MEFFISQLQAKQLKRKRLINKKRKKLSPINNQKHNVYKVSSLNNYSVNKNEKKRFIIVYTFSTFVGNKKRSVSSDQRKSTPNNISFICQK